MMDETQILMLRRQIELNARQVRERQMAMQMARQREMFHWIGGFYCLALPLAIVNVRAGRIAPSAVAPLVPITFAVAYNADMAYGNKMSRIRASAEEIMTNESDYNNYLPLPHGMPTVEAVDKAVADMLAKQPQTPPQ
jgi:hypothetical protein